MKKLLLAAAILLLSITGAQAQCTASYTVAPDTTTPYPYDMIFTNTSNPTVGTVFDWYFYGGATPSQEIGVNHAYSPVISYSGPGSYNVQLSLVDTMNACQDSLFSSIVVPGSALACTTSSVPSQCGLCNGSASVIASGGTPPYTYSWSNGSTNDSLSGLCTGTYTVTVTDTYNLTSVCTVNVAPSSGLTLSLSTVNNQACPGEEVTINTTVNGSSGYSYAWSTGDTNASIDVSTAGTYTVTVTDVNGCTAIDSALASFAPPITLSISGVDESCASCCDGSAYPSTVGGNGALSFLWSNGSTNDTITSLCPGTYTLTVTDTLYGCTYVDSVVIAPYNACYAISGNVDQALLGDARVYLIEESNNILTAIDSTVTDSLGDYAFTNVCAGTYYVKAALLPTHIVFSSFLPTYYNGAQLWLNANGLVISNASMNNVDIVMMSGTNNGGPGFVGGNISQGANSTSANPIRGGRSTIANLPFILTDENDQLAAFTYSDANGDYSISDLELGSYKLYVDYLNKVSYPLTFTLTESSSSLENADFVINEDDIKPFNPTGLANELRLKAAQLYPNPTNGLVKVESELLIEAFSVIGVDGRVITEERVNNRQTNIDLSELDRGTYIIQIKHAEQVDHHVMVKE
jgi:hypothetical protein